MIVKHRSDWGYETLMREVSDSIHPQRFCRIGMSDRVPDEPTVRKLTRRLGAEEVVHEITREVIAKARRQKRFRPPACAQEDPSGNCRAGPETLEQQDLHGHGGRDHRGRSGRNASPVWIGVYPLVRRFGSQGAHVYRRELGLAEQTFDHRLQIGSSMTTVLCSQFIGSST